MLNFKQLVESFLLEAGYNSIMLQNFLNKSKNRTNGWIYDLLELHNTTPATASILITQNLLEQCFIQALGGYNAAPKPDIVKTCMPLERIYDAIYTVVKNAKNARLNVNDITSLQVTNVTPLGIQIIKNIKQSIRTNNGEWKLQNADVIRAYEKLMEQQELIAKAALETYYKKSIIQMINEAVKKRTDVFSRAMSLRNPFGTPFQNLIKDVLINPEAYASGNKKVTNDFKQIVDDLYFRQLILIGTAAKDLYKANSGQQPVNNIDYENMLNNKSGGYTIEDIDNMGTKESLTLINALRDIAEYERKKTGRGERVKYAAQAAGSLASAAGAKLYG